MIRAGGAALAALVLAGAAQAQTPLQTGLPRNGTMPAAGPGVATCYTIKSFTTVTIEAIVRSDAFDPMVEVAPGSDCLARDGWSDDDGGAGSGGPLDARIVTEPLPAGDYVVRVRRADGGSGPYRVMAMTGTSVIAGADALNSPTVSRSIASTPPRDFATEARERALAEVAAGYNPPPRPAGYAGLSDGDLLQALGDSVGDGPGMFDRVRDMDPVAREWMRYHNRLVVNEYLAGTNAWANANPSAAQLARRQAAQARTQAQAAQAQAAARQASASRLSEYERGVFARTMTELAGIPDDGDGIRRMGVLFRATLHCGNITPYLPRMSPEERARADAECPWADINRMNAEGVGGDTRPPGIAGNPISPFAPRDPGPGTGNVNVRTYDARTGSYTGTTVMSPLEAELSGARPR